MDKNIKNCYKTLDLPYDVTVEDVKTKQKIMVKVYRARAIRTNKNFEKEIKKVNDASLTLIDFINNNGVQKAWGIRFETSWHEIGLQFFALTLSVFACFSIFMMLF